MKKSIAYIVSLTLYGIGEGLSKPMQWFDWAWLYPVYSKIMITSFKIQDWAGNEGPWRVTVNNDD